MPYFETNHERAMKRVHQAARFRVKWKDIFNVKQFYRALHEWSNEYHYVDLEDRQDHYETLYLERIGHFGEKELWVRWRWIKSLNEYFMYHIDLDFHYLYLLPTEIIHEGKKLKKDMYKGEVEVWVTALLEWDWQAQWEKHWFLRYFSKIFPERIFRKSITDEHKLELYREAYILQNFIKQWFKLKRYLPYEEVEPFYPSHAFSTYSGGDAPYQEGGQGGGHGGGGHGGH